MKKNEILLNLIEHYTGGNKRRFAQMLGVSPQSVSAWIKRDTFDVDILSTKCSGINPSYLLTGDGPMLLSQDSKTEENEDKNVKEVKNVDVDKLMARMDALIHTIDTIEKNRAAELQQRYDEIDKTQSLLSRMLSVVENMTASLQHHAPLH